MNSVIEAVGSIGGVVCCSGDANGSDDDLVPMGALEHTIAVSSE